MRNSLYLLPSAIGRTRARRPGACCNTSMPDEIEARLAAAIGAMDAERLQLLAP
ncbi:MAG TPA: hypothetical protein VKU77_31950 [Streptosporangiaceae bacterium]|nr:hypothetical protein [Streptosporangiaceae bacterium]